MASETALTQENIKKILKGITIPSPPQVIAEHHSAIDIFTEKDKTNPDEKYLLGILKLGEHLADLSRIIGNNESDIEWQQIEETILEYLGLSQFDYDDLVVYAADSGIGGQTYFM